MAKTLGFTKSKGVAKPAVRATFYDRKAETKKARERVDLAVDVGELGKLGLDVGVLNRRANENAAELQATRAELAAANGRIDGLLERIREIERVTAVTHGDLPWVVASRIANERIGDVERRMGVFGERLLKVETESQGTQKDVDAIGDWAASEVKVDALTERLDRVSQVVASAANAAKVRVLAFDFQGTPAETTAAVTAALGIHVGKEHG